MPNKKQQICECEGGVYDDFNGFQYEVVSFSIKFKGKAEVEYGSEDVQTV